MLFRVKTKTWAEGSAVGSIILSAACWAVSLLGTPAFCSDAIPIKSFDGFVLNSVVTVPGDASDASVKRVVVFVHGSGPQNYDGDLSAITVPKGTKNLVYRDIAEALKKVGFATVRYNKRAFEAKKKTEADPAYTDSEEFKKFNADPLEYYVKDAEFFGDYAKKRFPNSTVYFLGHSEGTSVALQALTRSKNIGGVALIGFTNEPIGTSIFEQTVYRPLIYFQQADLNRDGIVDHQELNQNSDIAKALRPQLTVLDLNSDGQIDESEYKAGNYSNLVASDALYNQNYSMREAQYSRPSEIIRGTKAKILFLQGEWDNQTPAYFSRSIQLINNVQWKKDGLRFRFFPKAGHALDLRPDPQDLSYRKLTEETLNAVATELSGFFN
jgi:pimeloyl-ACP methyl ester carboxylesterase